MQILGTALGFLALCISLLMSVGALMESQETKKEFLRLNVTKEDVTRLIAALKASTRELNEALTKANAIAPDSAKPMSRVQRLPKEIL